MSQGDAATSGESGNSSDGGGGSRLGALVSTVPRKIAVAVVGLVLVVVAAFLLGIIGVPSVGLVDAGDWGDVNESHTEVVTTIWVNNDNPFPIALGDGLSASYEVAFNDVALAQGEKSAIEVPKGNSTMALETFIDNDKLPAWWVAFVRADETIAMDITGDLNVNLGPGASYSIDQQQTVLDDSTPIISALSAAANSTSEGGPRTATVSADSVSDDLLDGGLVGNSGEVTVGYDVREGSARWGSVTESQTTVLFEFDVHNPGDVPVPAVPDGLGVTIDMNDVTMFEGESGDLSPRSVDADAVIPPGETRTVTFEVRMDNDKVDEWFTSHVERDEVTDVSTQFQFVFEVTDTGQTFRIPENSPATYDCRLQTGILVDDQTTETNCGETPG
jgi:LEA14-like dessication related protein